MTKLGKTFCTGILVTVGLFFLREAWTDFAILRRLVPASATETGDVVARVLGHPITRSQLERAVRERLWLESKAIDSMTAENLRAERNAALDELIDQELLRSRAAVLAPGLKVASGEIDARLALMTSRFPSTDEMERAMKLQGITSVKELRDRLAARIQQEKYVDLKTGPLVKVTDDEALKWFDDHRDKLVVPERVEVRHIFLPTLDHPPEVAEAMLKSALADLTEKHKDFAALAKELSEDPATNDTGGSLGWMTRRRLPEDFAAAVFSLPMNQPSLVRSHLGWHLVEVTGRKPAEPQTFEQAKPEIHSALEAVKRGKAIEETRATLRREYSSRIEINQNKLAD